MELNFEKNDNKTDETDDSSLSFFLSVLTAIDIRVYIARILKKRNIVILIGVPLLMFSICAVSVKMFIVNDWTARCTLFRKTKDTHLKKDMPEIYSPIDVDTVLKTIKSRKNLINVIKTLGLKIPVISLSKQIEVTKHKNKQIITITVTNKDKEKASLIANTLSKVFLESYVKLQNSSAMEIYNYYNKSSISIQNEINTLEQKVQQYLTANKVIAIDDETSSKLEQLNELELKLLENQMRKSNLTVRLKHINEELIGMEDKVPLTYLIASGGKELAGKERTLAVLRQKYTDKNPKVIRLMSEIKELREEEKKRKTGEPVAEQITYGDNIVKQNLIVEKSNIKSQLLSLKSNIVDIQRSIDYLNKKLSKLSKVKTIKSQLQKKIEMNQNLLQKIKHVIAVSEIVSKSDISDIRILEEAVPAVYPESSMRKVLAGVGGIIGFILSLIFIFLPELLDFRVKSAKEIANILKIKSIGMLPNEDECRKNKHEFYEGLQVFLENINISLKGTEIPISVFCSSISETGKSFIINLFSEFLINRKMKVLYIDSVNEITDDIKENTINNFIYSNDSNIAECKVNKISESLDKMYFNLDDDTYRYPLEKAKLKQFFDIQKKKYDHIIVELFPFHDNRQLFSSFTAIADINVLVSRFRKSGKFSDKTLVDFINEYKSSNIVSLVNSVEYHYYKYLK